jgi:hypothetical protein
MSVQRRRSLYLLPKAPPIKEEVIEATSPTCQPGEEKKRPAPCVRDTMIDLLDRTVSCDKHGGKEVTDPEKKAELQLFGSEKHMAALQDLSNLLYTRRRLQELGCTFTTMGELVTYGYPVTLKENEQLFRLGPIYDEQWSSFFSTAHTIRRDGDFVMWADMRTLKRVLANENIIFNCSHGRLTHGDGSAKLIRLCTAYDDLHKLWSSEKPSHVLTPIVEKEEEADEGFDDSGCFLHEECSVGDYTDGLASDFVGTQQASSPIVQREHELAQPEPRPSSREPGPTQRKSGPVQREPEAQPEPETTYCNQSNRSSLPRNIGWRFSDDIVHRRDSLSDDGYDELEEDLQITVTAPLRISEADLAKLPSTFEPETSDQVLPIAVDEKSLQTVSHKRCPSCRWPLRVWRGSLHKVSAERLTGTQNFTTTSMMYIKQPTIDPHYSVSTSSNVDLKAHATLSSAFSSKRKGFRKWWRGVFGRPAS